jgi:mannosyl-3-phosphoglycerate phosphatase
MQPDRQPLRTVLFSDVDGTLLGPRGGLALAPQRMRALALRIDIVLASSRTLAELRHLHRVLGIVGPLAAENGAVLALPLSWGTRVGRGGSTRRRWAIHYLGEPASQLMPRVRKAAALAGVDWRAISPPALGSAAAKRTHSVLLRPGPNHRGLLESLRALGLEASSSGRWITVTQHATKGRAVREVLARAAASGTPYQFTAAIGDAENDAEMLRAVALPFVIRTASGHHPELARIPGAVLLRAQGLAGFREAARILLREAQKRC